MHHDFAPQAVTEQRLLRTFPTVGLSSMRDAGTTFFSFFVTREGAVRQMVGAFSNLSEAQCGSSPL